MALIIKAKMGEQTFENTISTLINGKRNFPEGKEVHLEIRKNRLMKLVQSSDPQGDET